ncbi:hypothetical protein GCM10011348_33920 [Marinobacterium nitratireducens]|uniref:DUF112 domain-containing protein n=1 Tax=Marinobacterium nitratireducens TaxID=518897 RepID=A0A917ZKF2_9GAMM|nr:tripartite tricarboxylate transporter permease [Marinobacterium nitratireducens]GGO85423.1 hypothetical protein GCM10011348_33920 [Marinobacterium nitratireducens]
MDILLNNLMSGISEIAHLNVILCLLAGSTLGVVIGAIPGLGPAVAIAVLLPATFSMTPLAGLSLLLGIYCGAWYSGSIPAILINTPGTPVAVLSTYDGYPMARQGLAKRALGIAFTSSFIGGMLSVLVLILLAGVLAGFAKNFGAAEFTMLTLFGIMLVIISSRGKVLATSFMLGIGLFLSTVGLGGATGMPRYTFGTTALLNGIPLVPVVLGIFAIAQALILIESSLTGAATQDTAARKKDDPSIGNQDAGVNWQSIKAVFEYPRTLLRSAGFGVGIGVLPGVGEFLAQFMSYVTAKRASRSPETFGKGNPEGLIASETANNAVTGAALVPLLALGIPGEALTAMMMSVFMVHNVFPGPRLFEQSPELVNGIYVSMLLMNIFIFVLLLSLTRWCSLVTRINPKVLGVTILALAFVGAYSVNLSLVDVWLALGFGVFGYLARRLGLPVFPLILAMVLGPIIETRLRQSLTISDGSLWIFVERPISLAVVSIMALILIFIASSAIRRKCARKKDEAGIMKPL